MIAVCSVSGCTRDALSALLIIPQRTDTPLCPEIRRALDWPDTELVTTVAACGVHREPLVRAAQVVMKETALGNAVAVRKVTGEIES